MRKGFVMSKKDNKKVQENSEIVEEVTETHVEEIKEPSTVEEVVEDSAEEVKEEVVSEPEESEEAPEPVEEESEEDLTTGYEDYTGEFTPDKDGKYIDLIVSDGTHGKVVDLLSQYGLIVSLLDNGERTVVGPFSGDKYNEAIRIVAGCGIMFSI